MNYNLNQGFHILSIGLNRDVQYMYYFQYHEGSRGVLLNIKYLLNSTLSN